MTCHQCEKHIYRKDYNTVKDLKFFMDRRNQVIQGHGLEYEYIVDRDHAISLFASQTENGKRYFSKDNSELDFAQKLLTILLLPFFVVMTYALVAIIVDLYKTIIFILG